MYKVRIDFSRRGKPTDNAHVESFNGRLRDECLNSHWFVTMADAKREIEVWRRDYNEGRPQEILGNRTPKEFALAAGTCAGGKSDGMPKLSISPVPIRGDPQIQNFLSLNLDQFFTQVTLTGHYCYALFDIA